MHAHAHSDVASLLQRLTDLQSAFNRDLRIGEKTIPSPVGNRSSLPAASAWQNDGVTRTISFNWHRNVDCSLVASFDLKGRGRRQRLQRRQMNLSDHAARATASQFDGRQFQRHKAHMSC